MRQVIIIRNKTVLQFIVSSLHARTTKRHRLVLGRKHSFLCRAERHDVELRS